STQSNDPIESGLSSRRYPLRSTFVDEFLPLPRVAKTCLRVTNNRIVKDQHWPPARGRGGTRRPAPPPPRGNHFKRRDDERPISPPADPCLVDRLFTPTNRRTFVGRRREPSH